MTTQTFDWTGSHTRIASGMLAQARALEALGKMATRAAVAFVPAMAILVAASWAISAPGMMEYFQAILWSCGFIAFALAVESGTVSGLVIRLATGITVQVLTWMSDSLAPEMAVVAAALLAVCTAVAIFRRT